LATLSTATGSEVFGSVLISPALGDRGGRGGRGGLNKTCDPLLSML
jgi:hypothetical protein